MKLKDKIKVGLSLLKNSGAYVMKAGDNAIIQTSNGKEASEITQQVSSDSVMSDLLNEQETQRMKETRDAYYRVFLEAEKYHIETDQFLGLDKDIEYDDKTYFDESLDIKVSGRKKTKEDFTKHVKVDESDGLKLKLIQDNKEYDKYSAFVVGIDIANMKFDPFDFIPLLELEFSGFNPRYPMDKLAKKIVVKELNNTESIVELYFASEAGRYTKTDAVFIAELYRLLSDKSYKSEVKDVSNISFTTDKPWNDSSLSRYEFDNVEFEDIYTFDGSFVLRYKCHNHVFGVNVSDKFKTKELDEKYASHAPKKDATDVFAIEREINGINFNTEKISIKDDNSD